MNKKQVEGTSRDLMEAHFERVAEAIKGGKETNSLTYPELSEELVEKFKGKTLNAPLEVVFTSCLFLTAQELVGLIETLKELSVMLLRKELLEKAKKGEATKEDAMAAMMLAMLSMDREENTTEKSNE